MSNLEKFLDHYHKWEDEVKFLSNLSEENTHYVEMVNLCLAFPNEIVPIIKDILLDGPNHIVGVLNNFPFVKIEGYIPLIENCNVWLNIINNISNYNALNHTINEENSTDAIEVIRDFKNYYEKYDEWKSYTCQYEDDEKIPNLQEFTNNRQSYKEVLTAEQIKNKFMTMKNRTEFIKSNNIVKFGYFKYDENLSDAQNAEKYFEANCEYPNEVDMLYAEILRYEKQNLENKI